MLPSSLLHFTGSLHHYHHIHKGYTSQIEQVEDLLRALSLLLPGRVSDGDLCSQSILTTLNLVSLYNTHYLISSADENGSEKDVFAFNQRLRHQFRRSSLIRIMSSILSIVSYTEVLLEMIATRKCKSANMRWQLISWLEGFKVLLRVALYARSQKNMILHPTHFIRNVDPSTLAYDIAGEEKIELTHLDTRTGVPSSANSKLLYGKSYSEVGAGSRKTKWAHLGELLWILRPFIYVLLLKKEHTRYQHSSYKMHKSSAENQGCNQVQDDEECSIEKDDENYWLPWLMSLSVDVLAAILRFTQNLSPLESEESKRRNYLLLFYFLRGPVYSMFTKRGLDVFCNATEHRPLISIVTTAINDYRPFWEQNYFYTAGS
ncbi:peroxisome membrane protein [Absidia repens]|uniref:Peroxisomal membrane protein PEX16 n=1 Tax=Absidia repens TaxID=90262 RepID=A0A1X2INQ9_9FUNG|nr:peroxisome membrane protein [Absidia repens]